MSSPRLATPNRTQYQLIPSCLDDVLAPDHVVRDLWAYVEKLDLSDFYAAIKAVPGAPGRSATDPKLLLALWLFATTEGVGSARLLDRLCKRDLAYMWLCGGVGVNYHTLADFRAENKDLLTKLLGKHVAALRAAGVVQLKVVVQDGVRIRAHAGSSSFRRRATLEQHEKEARELVAALEKELHDDPEGSDRRVTEARKRVEERRLANLEKAHAEAKKLEEKRAASGSHKSKAEQEKSKRKVAKGEVRASTTDPDARRMKMGDGGYRPAYNQQVAMDPDSGVILAVETSNEGLDGGMLPSMVKQLKKAYDTLPEAMIADGGFVTKATIDELHKEGIKVYAPVDKPRTSRDPHAPLPGDSEAVGQWRRRMGTDEGRAEYKKRPKVEWCFARFRNWGLRQFLVRTRDRVHSSFLLYAFTHNVMLAIGRERRALADATVG